MTEPPAPAGTVAYRAGGSIYLNITNRCSSSCEFCIRDWTDGVYGEDLRLEHEPELDEVTQAIELAFMDGPADEVVFCGFVVAFVARTARGLFRRQRKGPLPRDKQ